jgi:hypothetical protein
MGYEVIIHYREIKDEELSEDVKKKKIKVGSPYDDLELDVCAGKVIAQLANRKRKVEEVEIFQFTKKKLSYKETEDAIFIKNRKFSFDDGPVVQSSGQTPEEQLMTLLQANPTLLQNLGQMVQPQQLQALGQTVPQQVAAQSQVNGTPNVSPLQGVGQRVLRKEVFDPPHPGVAQIEQGFTVGKEYPIYEEISRGMPPFTRNFYLVGDNNGKKSKKPAEFFVPQRQKLKHADDMMGDDRESDIQLDYGDSAWEGAVGDIKTY